VGASEKAKGALERYAVKGLIIDRRLEKQKEDIVRWEGS
jgi:hypothetical protein